MRLPMASRKVTRSYSGRGFGVGGTSTDDDSGEVVVQLNSAQPRNKKRGSGSKKPDATTNNTTPAQQAMSTQSSVMWIFFSMGLIFCLADIVYIMKYVMPQHVDVIDTTNSHNVMAAAAAAVVVSPADQPLQPTDTKDRSIQTLPSDWIGDDKEPILKLLEEAVGGDEVDEATVARLPTAQQVAAMYGRDPVVLGLETCGRFQAYGDPAEHFVSTAGSFNTGTNLMAELLIANCRLPARMQKYGTKGVRWQVLWGKHTPVDNEEFRQSHRTYDDLTVTANNMFPAVMVRDPFKWMQSVRADSIGSYRRFLWAK
jgi:hypothetical protein